ncbi:MAG: type IV pili twitching motility protein PilT, partial [Desulfuromonas sp.]|nr:type IV pili twitching motility protein PilT [Desulfuromonas sp.]
MAGIHDFLKIMVDSDASDLHLTTGLEPQIRIDGAMRSLAHPKLMPNDTKHLCYSILTDSQKRIL